MKYLKKIKSFDERFMIIASPELIEPLDTKLNNHRDNKKLYLQYGKKRGALILEIAPNIKLYRLNIGADTGEFIAFDDVNKKILYKMCFEPHKIFGHNFAVQSFVWSSKDLVNFNIKGQSVSSYIFFNFLIKAAEGVAISSDAFHTPDGMEFWFRRVSQALFKNYHVYLIDLTKDVKTKVNDSDDFEDKVSAMKIWMAKGGDGQNRRVIISSKALW
jgi:hypothetical protein